MVAVGIHFENAESIGHRGFACPFGIRFIRPGDVRQKRVFYAGERDAAVSRTLGIYFDDVFLVRRKETAVVAVRYDRVARFGVVNRYVVRGFAVFARNVSVGGIFAFGYVIAVEEQTSFGLVNDRVEVEFFSAERVAVFLYAVYAGSAVTAYGVVFDFETNEFITRFDSLFGLFLRA